MDAGRKIQVCLLAVAAILVSACWDLNNPVDPLAEDFQGQRVYRPVELRFDSSEVRLAAGKEASISVYATYEDGSQKNVSDAAEIAVTETAVVSVEPNGTALIVSGLKPGTTKIDARYAGLTTQSRGATLEVRVVEAPLESIEISPSSRTIPVGASVELSVLGTYQDGHAEDVSAAVRWSVEGDAVSWRRTDDGTITVVGAVSIPAGSDAVRVTATITASDGTPLHASASVVVNEATIESLAVVPEEKELDTLAVGQSVSLTVRATYSDGTVVSLGPDSAVEWAISDLSAISINGVGGRWMLSAVAESAEPVTIAATHDGVSSSDSKDYLTIRLTPPVVERLILEPSSAEIAIGETIELADEVSTRLELSDGATRLVDDTAKLSWHSEDESIVAPVAAGFRGVTQGSTAIVAEYAGPDAVEGPLSARLQVVVGPARLLEVVLTPKTDAAYHGESLQFSLAGSFSDGRAPVDFTNSAEWSIDSDGTATGYIDAGLLTVEGQGELRVTATIPVNDGTLSDSATVTVHPKTMTIESLEIVPSDEKIRLELAGRLSTRRLYAVATYSDGSTSTSLAGLTWTSSDANVATIDSGKLVVVTAVGHGRATIHASIPDGDGGTTGDSVVVCVSTGELQRLDADIVAAYTYESAIASDSARLAERSPVHESLSVSPKSLSAAGDRRRGRAFGLVPDLRDSHEGPEPAPHEALVQRLLGVRLRPERPRSASLDRDCARE